MNRVGHTDCYSSILLMVLTGATADENTCRTYRCIPSHLQYSLSCLCGQRLCARNHAIGAVDHTSPAWELDKVRIGVRKYGLCPELFSATSHLAGCKGTAGTLVNVADAPLYGSEASKIEVHAKHLACMSLQRYSTCIFGISFCLAGQG